MQLSALMTTPLHAHVVVAEDDPDMRHLVSECLRRDEHDVLEVGDGGRLLVRIGRQYRRDDPEPHIDLIVTDVRMPLITGLEILRGLRAAECTTPVVLMTAFSDRETRREATDLRAVLLEKPFAMAQLRAVARRLLEHRPHALSPCATAGDRTTG